MNFLKKLFKKNNEYKPSNRLEELMLTAATNEAYRPDFYRQLFHFQLFVIGKSSEEGSVRLLNNEIDGKNYSYAYTSLSALDSIVSKRGEELPYLKMDCHQFFNILAASELGMVLNADMDFGKVFSPSEIVDLMGGNQSNVEERVIEKGSEFRIGLPANTPDELIQALGRFIVKNEDKIIDIYFALKAEGEELSYIAALDIEENYKDKVEGIIKDISIIFNEVGSDLPVDMTLANDFYHETFKDGGMLSCKASV